MNDEVILLVNGQKYRGWISVEIKKSLRGLAGLFNLKITDSTKAHKRNWAIYPGAKCELFIGSEKLITGHVDDLTYKVNSTTREIAVTGRCKTADLVDCSIDVKANQWKSLRLTDLLIRLCSPFGISIINESGINPIISDFKVNPDTTVYEAIDKLAKKYGFIATSTPEGNLLIPQVAATFEPVYIEEGVNMVEGNFVFDFKERFSEYTIKSQDNSFTDDDAGYSITLAGLAKDPGIERYKPLVISMPDAASQKEVDSRASWEKILREAKSTTSTVVVKGWRRPLGSLWKENIVVTGKSSYLNLEAKFLITDISYTFNESGKRVSLELIRPEAYKAQIQIGVLSNEEDPAKSLGKQFWLNS